jgi:hypothetical protein
MILTKYTKILVQKILSGKLTGKKRSRKRQPIIMAN